MWRNDKYCDVLCYLKCFVKRLKVNEIRKEEIVCRVYSICISDGVFSFYYIICLFLEIKVFMWDEDIWKNCVCSE